MNRVRIFLCLSLVLFIGVALGFAQDEGEAEAVKQESKDSDVQWFWGEVVSIDLKNNVVIIKHLDHEDNQEKESPISVDSGTVCENFKSLEEIKPLDFLSIDYVINSDGKNVAKNINLDKPKESQTAGKAEVVEQAQAKEQLSEQPAEAVGQTETVSQAVGVAQ
jgi:hypothetical protein